MPKTINISYLIIDVVLPYNIILERQLNNTLWSVTSTQCLTLKYPLLDGRVGTILGDQQVAHECYLSILETIREDLSLVDAHPFKVQNDDSKGWDAILGSETECFTPIEDLKEAQIWPHVYQVTTIGTSLSAREEQELFDWLRRNVNLISWGPSDTLGIDTKVVSHRLASHPSMKLVANGWGSWARKSDFPSMKK